MVPIAIAIPGRNVYAPAFVDLARSIADAAVVKFANAVVHVVAHPITIDVSVACTAAQAKGVELVPLAIAISGWNVCTPAFVDFARSVANATFVEFPHAAVYVVADAIFIDVSVACAAAHTQGVELVSFAVAVPGGDVSAPTFIDVARTVAYATGVQVTEAGVKFVTHTIIVTVDYTVAITVVKWLRVITSLSTIIKEIATIRVIITGLWISTQQPLFITADSITVGIDEVAVTIELARTTSIYGRRKNA